MTTSKGGRPRKDVQHATAERQILDSAPKAASLIRDLLTGTRKRISYIRYNAAIFVLEQCLGKARQKAEIHHTGQPLTYQELSESAEKVVKEAEESGKTVGEVIKEAEEVAKKYSASENKEAP